MHSEPIIIFATLSLDFNRYIEVKIFNQWYIDKPLRQLNGSLVRFYPLFPFKAVI